MKKLIKLVFVAALLLSFTQQSKAQDGYGEGNIDLFLDFGFTTGLGLAPVSVGGNFMINDNISVGAEVGFRMDNSKYWVSYADHRKLKRSGFDFITRGDYHFNELLGAPDEFDIFAGIDVGIAFYGNYKHENYIYQDSKVYFLAGPHIGGKWFFSEKFGVHMITGWRSNDGYHLGFGVIFKLK